MLGEDADKMLEDWRVEEGMNELSGSVGEGVN